MLVFLGGVIFLSSIFSREPITKRFVQIHMQRTMSTLHKENSMLPWLGRFTRKEQLNQTTYHSLWLFIRTWPVFTAMVIRILEERSYANKIFCFFHWSQEVYYLWFYFTQAWRVWGFSEGHHSALYGSVVIANFFQFSKYRNSIPYLEVCIVFICFSSLCRSYWLNHFHIGMVSTYWCWKKSTFKNVLKRKVFQSERIKYSEADVHSYN